MFKKRSDRWSTVSDRVLVIEDDPDIALGVRTVLGRSGFEVTTAAEGREGLRPFHSDRPDIVILDVGLPEMDGWTVLERIRELSEVPVLMLTSHGQEADKVRGLRGGADDYLTKPFGNAEFVARVQALLRRQHAAAPLPEVFDDGRVRVDFVTHQVLVDGAAGRAHPHEFRLLAALVRHRGQVLSSVKLLELAWSDPSGIGPDRVKYSVMRLRRKLGTPAGGDSPIEAVRGFGYRYRGAAGLTRLRPVAARPSSVRGESAARRTEIPQPAASSYSEDMSEISRLFPLGGQALEPLWREVLGSRLRALRTDRDETLAQTAERAGISPQYLSEVERGRKEPSSEMIAALAGALDVTVADLMAGAAQDLRRAATVVVHRHRAPRCSGPSGQRPSGPVALAMAA